HSASIDRRRSRAPRAATRIRRLRPPSTLASASGPLVSKRGQIGATERTPQPIRIRDIMEHLWIARYSRAFLQDQGHAVKGRRYMGRQLAAKHRVVQIGMQVRQYGASRL